MQPREVRECVIYDKNGKRILSAPSIKEAEWAWDELCIALPKYKNKNVEWQLTFLDDVAAIGGVV